MGLRVLAMHMQLTVLGLFYKDCVLLINAYIFRFCILVQEVSSANQHSNGADLLRGDVNRLLASALFAWRRDVIRYRFLNKVISTKLLSYDPFCSFQQQHQL